MNTTKKRTQASWLLLAVFLPMLVLSSLHVHTTIAATGVECADCVKHHCHGHMLQLDSQTHDCVLCQFLTLTFVTAATAVVVCLVRSFTNHFAQVQREVITYTCGIPCLRAPPAV